MAINAFYLVTGTSIQARRVTSNMSKDLQFCVCRLGGVNVSTILSMRAIVSQEMDVAKLHILDALGFIPSAWYGRVDALAFAVTKDCGGY